MAAATIVDGLCAEGRVSEKPLSRPSGQVNDRAVRRRNAYSCAYAEKRPKSAANRSSRLKAGLPSQKIDDREDFHKIRLYG